VTAILGFYEAWYQQRFPRLARLLHMPKKKPKAPTPAPIGFGRRPMPDEAGDEPRKKASDYLTDEDFVDEADDDQPAKDPGDFSDPNFDILMEEIGKRFEPAASLEEAGLQLTTKEVFDRLQTFYPSLFYSVQLVFNALKELGFKYDDPYRNMNFVWLFK
jgi:hypothetical protein